MKMQDVDAMIKLASDIGMVLEMDYSGPVFVSHDGGQWTDIENGLGRVEHDDQLGPGWEFYSDKAGRSLKNPRFIDDDGETWTVEQALQKQQEGRTVGIKIRRVPISPRLQTAIAESFERGRKRRMAEVKGQR